MIQLKINTDSEILAFITRKSSDGRARRFYETKRKRRRNGSIKEWEEFEGIRCILEERKLWHDLDRTPGRQGKKWRLRCENNDSSSNPECCAQHCLALQDDFKFQRSALQEVLLRHSLLFDLYPKFHCECNWIERYWADLKREVRRRCDYSFSGLKQHLPIALDNASPPGQPPTKIRRYFKRCMRYIEAHGKGMDAWAADEEVKKIHHQELRIPPQSGPQ